MNAKVKISDIVGALEVQDDVMRSFVNVRTGEVATIMEGNPDFLPDGRPEEELPEWQQDELRLRREIASSDDFVALPDQFELHEYSLMRRFAESRDNAAISDRLTNALRGKGAFRRFKDTALELGVMDDWYRYRDQAYAEVARYWCTENGIELDEGDVKPDEPPAG